MAIATGGATSAGQAQRIQTAIRHFWWEMWCGARAPDPRRSPQLLGTPTHGGRCVAIGARPCGCPPPFTAGVMCPTPCPTNTSVRTVFTEDLFVHWTWGRGGGGGAHMVDCPDSVWRNRAPGPHRNTARQAIDGLWTEVCGPQRQSNDPRQQPAQPPIRQLLGAADVQTAHPATFSTAPTHQRLGSANAETTPAGAPAAAAVRTQRPDATCEGTSG